MYVKIHEQIFSSSIMEEDVETRYIWFCLLTLADKEGFIDITIPAISRRINLDEKIVSHAIEKFMLPDKTSRTPDFEGRRLEKIRESFGWKVLNYIHYRDLRNDEARREYMRNYMKDKRNVNKIVNTKFTEVTGNSCKHQLAKADADADADAKTEALPQFIPNDSWYKWVEHRKKQKKPMTEYAKELAINKLIKLHKEGHNPKDVIENSIENNYQGLYPNCNKKPIQKNEFGY